MNNRKHFLAILFLTIGILLIQSACKKDTPNEELPNDPADIIIKDDVKYLNDNDWSDTFISTDSISGTYYFNSNINEQNLSVGDVLVSSYGEGLLRVITEVNSNNGQIEVKTSQGTLEDIFDQVDIDFEKALTVNEIKSIEYHGKGMILDTSIRNEDYNWTINKVMYDSDDNPQTEYDQIRLEGNFNFDWNFILKIRISYLTGLKEVKAGFESDESLKLKLIAGLAYSKTYEHTLATIHFNPITIPVGPIVIVIIPSLPIKAGVTGYANASITTSIDQSLSFDVGVIYLKENGWSTYSEFNNTLDYSPPQLNINAGAEAYIKPEFITKIYGVAGPYANIKLYGNIEADLLQNPWWSLYAGGNMNAGAKAEIFSKFLFDFEVDDLLEYEKLLAQSSDVTNSQVAILAFVDDSHPHWFYIQRDIDMLDYLGISYDVIDPENLNDATLSKYKLLIIPTVWAQYSWQTSSGNDAIKNFIHNGGALIATEAGVSSMETTPGFFPYSITINPGIGTTGSVTIIDPSNPLISNLTIDDFNNYIDSKVISKDENWQQIVSVKGLDAIDYCEYGSGFALYAGYTIAAGEDYSQWYVNAVYLALDK